MIQGGNHIKYFEVLNLLVYVICTHAHGSLSDQLHVVKVCSWYYSTCHWTHLMPFFFLGKKDMVPLNRAEAADQMTKVGGFCGLTWGMDFPANTQDVQ